MRETALEIAHQLHLPERGTMVLGEPPTALSRAFGETQLDQELKPPEHLESHLPAERGGGNGRFECDPSCAVRALLQDAVEDPEVARFDSPLACEGAVALASEPERAGGELLAPHADPVGHVLPRYPELMTLARAASDRDVNMRVGGVVMLDRHPLEVHAEVAL